MKASGKRRLALVTAGVALACIAVLSGGVRAQEEPAAAPARELTGDSTLSEWKAATSSDRSRVAVALSRNRLPPDASKLDVAKMAMEITGCVSATAEDERMSAWKVAPTAATCLTAPEREAK